MGKRALVVDDSKSSRLFLERLLIEQQVQVDAAESAEAAIEYLGRNRPDVIFMDHLMPGMDGFQAVQAIKANPRTAQIPILMYTSQEGELYLGQAQALGAAGVLAKGATEAGELGSLLASLWAKPALESSIVVEAVGGAEPATRPAMPAVAPEPAAEAWRSEITALREQLGNALAAQRTAIGADLRTLLREARTAEAPAAAQPDRPRHSPLPWTLALLAAIGAAVCGTLYWQSGGQIAALRADLATSKEAVALLTARLAPPPETAEPVAESGADVEATIDDATIDAGTAAAVTAPAASPRGEE